MIFTFVVHYPPTPKARPRVCKTGHVYTPQKTIEAENQVKIAFAHACRNANYKPYFPMYKAIKMVVVLYFAKPKRPKDEIYPIVRPDADNCLKLIMDALNNLAFNDDSQIVDLIIKKRYCDTELEFANPCMYISLEQL
jgi:Holliday junction resolvase RusA-like endonuclease